MQIDAIAKAKMRMTEASAFFDAMTLTPMMTVAQFEQRWSGFLNAVNRTFNALDAGARDNAKTRTWWSKKKHEWKNDPLLQYLHQARNTDEHGIASLSKLVPGYHSKIVPPRIDPNRVSHFRLGPVRSRWGDVFDPPGEHLGQKLTPGEGDFPTALAARAMGYYNILIMEAEKYVT